MDLDSFLVSLYVLVDDWWKLDHASQPPKTGRPALLSDPEVITLAILAQWPRFRSERDFWRFAAEAGPLSEDRKRHDLRVGEQGGPTGFRRLRGALQLPPVVHENVQ